MLALGACREIVTHCTARPGGVGVRTLRKRVGGDSK